MFIKTIFNKGFYVVLTVFAFFVFVSNAYATGESDNKVATSAYLNNTFQPLEQDLNDAIDDIDDLVTNVVDHSYDIENLATGKQDRPGSSCPQGRDCLLVKNPGAANVWFPITHCEYVSFLENTVPGGYAGGSDRFGAKSGANTSSLCGTSGVNCGSDEWVSSYTGGLVYGRARRVNISQRAGTVIELDSSNLPANNGQVCICQATRYRAQNSGIYGESQAINTNKWVVIGTSISGNQISSDWDCLVACARDDLFSKQAYNAEISTSCTD